MLSGTSERIKWPLASKFDFSTVNWSWPLTKEVTSELFLLKLGAMDYERERKRRCYREE